MAKEMGLHFARWDVFVGIAKMDANGKIGKSDAALKALAEEVRAALASDARRRAA
jgi:hypothetical protein